MRTWVLGIPQYVTSDPVQRRDQDTGLKIENPCPKFRIHLGLFFVTARKKVDGFVTTKMEVDWFVCDLEKEGKCFLNNDRM